ncbi:MAG: hypothetical protein AAGH19_08815 [Pseudomonadota bacterium]
MRTEHIFLLAVLVTGVLLYQRWGEAPIEHGPGVLVAEDPIQETVGASEFQYDDYTMTRRARFELRARVLSRRDYRFDAGADLVPVDLALGWGPMSDQAILDRISVSQSGRWFHLRWDHPGPLSDDVAMRHSGNMHIIPGNPTVEDQLTQVREGHVVWLSGHLVDARRADGYHWNTSLSRTDTGGGSCELFYVERALVERIGEGS